MRSPRKPHSADEMATSCHSARIDEVVGSVLRDQEAGRPIDDANVAARHPELMPELGARLKTLRQIQAAGEYAKRHPVSPQDELRGECEPDGDLDALTHAFPGYEVIERIHYGGQGVVYKAEQHSPSRMVAIKVLLHGPFASTRQRLRFEREVSLVSRMRHPNIVTVYESAKVQGRPFLAMECVEGLPIDDFFLLHSTPIRARLELLALVCRAVGHAHQRGVIHRDLKPDNILVEAGGQPKILDFGLAKELSGSDSKAVSVEGQVVGTLPFLSPEQADGNGGDLDVRTDVYSLGVVLFGVLTGGFPYPVAGDPFSVRSNIVSREPARLRKVVREVDPDGVIKPLDIGSDLEAIAQKALTKSPDLRYQSAIAFAEDIERYLAGDPVIAKGTGGFYLLRKTVYRHRLAALLATVFLLLAGGFGGAIMRVTFQRDVAKATGALRERLARSWDTELVRQLYTHMVNTNRVAEIADLPPDVHESYLARYRGEAIDPVEASTDFARQTPKGLLKAIRNPGSQQYQAAVDWLESVDSRLTEIAETLKTSYVRCAPGPHTGFTWDSYGSEQLVAAAAVEALIGRAFLANTQGDRRRAIDDLTAARRIAQDLGDGVTVVHKTGSTTGRASAYTCAQHLLAESLRSGDPPDELIEWLRADPPLVSVSAAIRVDTGFTSQLVIASFESSPDDQRYYLNLDTLSDLTRGMLGELSDRHRDFAAIATPDDVERMFESFASSAEQWESMTLIDLCESQSRWRERHASESSVNPLMFLLPQEVGTFRARLATVAMRRALRLAGRVITYQRQYQRWPSSLREIHPADHEKELTDPMTGKAFLWDVDGGMPRLWSSFEPELDRETLLLMQRIFPGTQVEPDRVVYFPARKR